MRIMVSARVTGEWRVEIIVGNVCGHAPGSWCGDNVIAVVVQFVGGEGTPRGRAGIAGVVDEVASTNGESCSVFFCLVWFDIGHKLTVCWNSASRNFLGENELDGVGSLDVAYALRKATKFVA